MKIRMMTAFTVILAAFNFFSARADAGTPLPPEFTDVKAANPQILVEMRYFSDWNFIGRPIVGYSANRCILVNEAAQALSKVQRQLEKTGHSLLVFDCYRPQKAVTSFVTWTKDRDDQKMKATFYPDEPKAKLIARGYIDSLSGHSRGGTVDLTIVKSDLVKSGVPFHEAPADCRSGANAAATGQLDMGTTYDCFSVLSNTANPEISKEAKANRQLLKAALEKAGFKNYEKEWWHFTLRNEPFKDRAFDFNVEPE